MPRPKAIPADHVDLVLKSRSRLVARLALPRFVDAPAHVQEAMEQLGDVARPLGRPELRHHVPPHIVLASLQRDRCALVQPVPLHEATYVVLAMSRHLVTRLALNGTL